MAYAGLAELDVLAYDLHYVRALQYGIDDFLSYHKVGVRNALSDTLLSGCGQGLSRCYLEVYHLAFRLRIYSLFRMYHEWPSLCAGM